MFFNKPLYFRNNTIYVDDIGNEYDRHHIDLLIQYKIIKKTFNKKRFVFEYIFDYAALDERILYRLRQNDV